MLYRSFRMSHGSLIIQIKAQTFPFENTLKALPMTINAEKMVHSNLPNPASQQTLYLLSLYFPSTCNNVLKNSISFDNISQKKKVCVAAL